MPSLSGRWGYRGKRATLPPKDRQVGFRLTRTEYAQWREAATRHGYLSLPEWVVQQCRLAVAHMDRAS